MPSDDAGDAALPDTDLANAAERIPASGSLTLPGTSQITEIAWTVRIIDQRLFDAISSRVWREHRWRHWHD